MQNLIYKIYEKNGLVIVSFKGKIIKDEKSQFDLCMQETLRFEKKVIFFVLKEVTSIDQYMCRDLTVLQHEVRKKNKSIFLIGLDSALKSDLGRRGVVRAHELLGSLEEAIKKVS